MRTAIIVDDSRATRAVLRRILVGLGYGEIVEAGNGEEGLAAARGHDAEVMLLDWNMPVMDGLTLLKLLRNAPAYRSLKILMVTTESEIDRMVEALEAGADEYLMKPFTADDLRAKLTILGCVDEEQPEMLP